MGLKFAAKTVFCKLKFHKSNDNVHVLRNVAIQGKNIFLATSKSNVNFEQICIFSYLETTSCRYGCNIYKCNLDVLQTTGFPRRHHIKWVITHSDLYVHLSLKPLGQQLSSLALFCRRSLTINFLLNFSDMFCQFYPVALFSLKSRATSMKPDQSWFIHNSGCK